MKRFLTIMAALAALTSLVVADVAVSTQATGNTFNLLSTGGKSIDSITVVPSGTNVLVRLYDSNVAGITNVVAEYITLVPTVATVVTTVVGPTGITNNFTNTAMTMVSTTNAAATNTLSPVQVYATPSAAIGTFSDRFSVKKGLTISNDVACTIIVNYKAN